MTHLQILLNSGVYPRIGLISFNDVDKNED